MFTGEVSQISAAPRRSRRGPLRRVLPSRDATASDHSGLRAFVNAGSARESFAPIGSNLPGYDNYFCRDCRHIVHVRKGSVGFRACPTPGCSRPTEFGVYATRPTVAHLAPEPIQPDSAPRARVGPRLRVEK